MSDKYKDEDHELAMKIARTGQMDKERWLRKEVDKTIQEGKNSKK